MKFYQFLSSVTKKKFARKKKWQKTFELLHGFAASAMNYGYGSDFENSGELCALNIIKSKINLPNPILFDVGANTGHYSLALADIFERNCRIYSFEPCAKTFELLKKTTAECDCINPYNMALGNASGDSVLYSTEKNSEVASVIKPHTTLPKYGNPVSEIIVMDTLDNFCNQHDIDHIDFVKIDVEGFEINVLQGMSCLLEKNAVHFIQFEFGVPDIDAKVFFRDFWNMLNSKFCIYRIVADGLFEIKNYNPQLEIFSTSNFISERKQ